MSAWAGWAASAWAGLFALVSLYWAAGGMVGSDTLGVEIDRLAHERDASFVGVVWAASALKALAAALALALIQTWGRRLPRRLLLVMGWATGAFITLYALANAIQHALMASEVISTPEDLGADAVAWHLALWDPFWLIGGLLFLAAARTFQNDGCPEASSEGSRAKPFLRRSAASGIRART